MLSNSLQFLAMSCISLKYFAFSWNTLHLLIMACNVLQWLAILAMTCNPLQSLVIPCNSLKSTLQNKQTKVLENLVETKKISKLKKKVKYSFQNLGIAVFFSHCNGLPGVYLWKRGTAGHCWKTQKQFHNYVEPSISDNGGHNVHFTATGEVDTRSAILAS